MRNLLFRISYCGKNYHGWQVQKNALAVQEVVQDAIQKIFAKREGIIGCSRTDSGVHANEYFFNMHTENRIDAKKAVLALNTVLPDDIAVLNCEEVNTDFHARYCVREKEYIYKIWNDQIRNPFLNGLVYHYKYSLDVKALNQACKYFIGRHDFKSFCGSKSDIEDTVRTIYGMEVKDENGFVVFYIRGDGFLYNMVRIIVGTLLSTAQGRIRASDITGIINSGQREKAGKTAPACGLYLNKVIY